MQFSAALALLELIQQAAAAPAISSASPSTTVHTGGRPAVQTVAPVAASDTNRTIVDLGIEPSVLRIPVKVNPNFTPNVTNAVAAAQAKYVVIENQIQLEKRALEKRDLVKRARPVVATTVVAAGRPAVQTGTTSNASTSLACLIFPSLCKSTVTTTTAKASSASVTTRSSSTISSTVTSTRSSTSSSSTRTSTSSSLTKSSTSSSSTKSSTSSSSMKSSTSSSSIRSSTSSSSIKSPTSSSSIVLSTSSLQSTSTSVKSSSTFTTSSSTSSTSANPSSSSTSSSTSSSVKPSSSSTTSSTLPSSTLSSTTSTSSKSTTFSALPTLMLAAENIQLDSEFLSEISIGSNGDTVDLVMDTGSADLWMFSTDCSGCSSNHEFYRPSQSTTFVNTTTPFSLSYGDGSKTSGILGFDTVSIAGAPIQAQAIDVAHTISAGLQTNAMDGILGLGFPNLMSVQGTGISTPVTNMVNQNIIPSGKFGLQYVKTNHWSYAGGGGAWTFGGVDTSVISGALTTVPLSHAQYWMISMTKVSVGSVYSYAPTQDVIVDSGTTLILLDPASVSHIHSYLPGGRVSPDNSHYQIFCNASDPAYTGQRTAWFQVGGQNYGVPAADLAWYPESNTPGWCYSGIQPWSNSFGILGVMFLKNVYAVFDQTKQQMQFGLRTDVATITD